MVRVASWLTVISLLSLGVRGAEVHVHLTDHSAGGRCTSQRGEVAAVTLDAEKRTTRLAIGAPGSPGTLTLSGDVAWRIEARMPRCWSTAAEWSIGMRENVDVVLYDPAEITGAFVGSGQTRPQQIAGMVFLGAASADAVPSGAAECTLEFPRWRCLVPAAQPIDFRLEASPGFAPSYFWNVVAKGTGTTELEPQPLLAGASLSGWVADQDGHAVPRAKVRLLPAQRPAEDASRSVAARQILAATNERGFFLFAGTAPGDYRLVTEHAGFSPSVAPVTLHAGEALRWPRTITLLPPVTLEGSIDPPVAPDGSRWAVSLVERVPVDAASDPRPMTTSANPDGTWKVQGLRADSYRLAVRSGNSVFEERDVDLSRGSGGILHLTVERVIVRGTVFFGDDALANAQIRFTDGHGKVVRAASDADGRFDAAFPSAGTWSTLVLPAGTKGARIEAESITIPETRTGPSIVDIHLAGGRLKGSVTDASGERRRAAVSVERNGKPIAQQVTSEDASFDFIGLKEGDYAVSARGEHGATERPVPVEVNAKETREVRLVLERYRELHILVRTPAGTPATGALLRLSTDGGSTWVDKTADVEGAFEYAMPAGTPELLIVAVTRSYPAAIARVPVAAVERPVVLTLAPGGGKLYVRNPRVYLRQGDVMVPLPMLFLPWDLGGGAAAYLAPGSYSLCPGLVRADGCRNISIALGGDTVVDTKGDGAEGNP